MGYFKRGYALDLTRYGAKFISKAHIPGAALYGIGRNWDHESHPNDGHEYHGVGLRLNIGPKWVAHGELFEIPDHLWDWLDGIENNGHTYERKMVPVRITKYGKSEDDPETYEVLYYAWVYVHMHEFEKHAATNLIEGGVF